MALSPRNGGYASPLVGWDPDASVYFDMGSGAQLTDADAFELRGDYPFPGSISPDHGQEDWFGFDQGYVVAALPGDVQANLNVTSAKALADVGLSTKPRASWTQGDAINYIKRFRDLIISRPELYDDYTVKIAQKINLDRPEYSDALRGQPLDNQRYVAIMADGVQPAIDFFQPLADFVTGAGRAGTALVRVIDRGVQGVENASVTFPVVIPIVVLAIAYLLAKNTSRDVVRKFA